ncbi:MAG: RHS repeat protein, partial [Phycisphaerales bacterium]|nr:RHS repeat protein [Phycisphaerales bacterium]
MERRTRLRAGSCQAHVNGACPCLSGSTTLAYNAQNQLIYRNDPAGNIIEPVYDDAGREIHRKVTTLAGGFDGDVRRITTAYDTSGRVSTVGQYDNATPGSGSIVDEVKFTYEAWGNLDTFEQDHNSAVGAGGSVDDYEVSYSYAKATDGRHSVRRSTMTTPSGNVITYNYAGNGNLHDWEANRVTQVKDGGVVLAHYDYNGGGHVVGIDLREPDVFDVVYSGSSFPELDRHNRVISDTWTKDLGTDVDFYDVDITYEDDGTISRTEDNVWVGRDVAYTHDGLKRLTAAEEGTWNGSSITA